MRHYPRSHTRYQRLTPLDPIEEVEVGTVVAEDAVEGQVVNQVVSLVVKPISPHQHLQDQRGPSTQTFHQESGQGVATISDMGKVHTSVQNPLHVLGRIFTQPDLTSETGTSSAIQILLY